MPIATIGSYNILFVHIPKTGGSSIESFLEKHGHLSFKNDKSKHMTFCSQQHLHANPLKTIRKTKKIDWTFTIVRHPVARIVSEYKYQMRKHNYFRSRLSFSAWLKYSILRRKVNPYHRDNHFRPQVEFEMNDADIFYFENGIDNCISHIAEELCIPAPSSIIHEKKTRNHKFKITKKDINYIEKEYKEDLFQYSYNTDYRSLIAAGIQEENLAWSSFH